MHFRAIKEKLNNSASSLLRTLDSWHLKISGLTPLKASQTYFRRGHLNLLSNFSKKSSSFSQMRVLLRSSCPLDPASTSSTMRSSLPRCSKCLQKKQNKHSMESNCQRDLRWRKSTSPRLSWNTLRAKTSLWPRGCRNSTSTSIVTSNSSASSAGVASLCQTPSPENFPASKAPSCTRREFLELIRKICMLWKFLTLSSLLSIQKAFQNLTARAT